VAFSAADKPVLITGASSGVGAALARALAKDGAVVGLIARRRDRLAEVLADCQKASPESTMWVADLAESAAVGPLALAGQLLRADPDDPGCPATNARTGVWNDRQRVQRRRQARDHS
jgi:NAD(P)-dependent dehydrogenase (short-subunit alcohol dehydrogenase family)